MTGWLTVLRGNARMSARIGTGCSGPDIATICTVLACQHDHMTMTIWQHDDVP